MPVILNNNGYEDQALIPVSSEKITSQLRRIQLKQAGIVCHDYPGLNVVFLLPNVLVDMSK